MQFILEQNNNLELQFPSGREVTLNTAFIIKLAKLLENLQEQSTFVKEHLEGYPDWEKFVEDDF